MAQAQTELPELMTPQQVAEYLHRPLVMLDRWRSAPPRPDGTTYGPRYVKVEGRVLYRRDDLLAYIDQQTRANTRDAD